MQGPLFKFGLRISIWGQQSIKPSAKPLALLPFNSEETVSERLNVMLEVTKLAEKLGWNSESDSFELVCRLCSRFNLQILTDCCEQSAILTWKGTKNC